MSDRSSSPRTPLWESIATHCALVVAVCFALYPVLWVVALAFSGSRPPSPNVLPVANDPTLDHLAAVVLPVAKSGGGSTWLFGRQLANSIVVSIATAAVGVAIAIPAAYALARF